MDNVLTALASKFLIGSSLFFHLTRTRLKDWMSLKVCRIRPRTYELAALEHLEKSSLTYNGRNVVTALVLSILNGSFLFLQIRRTTIKACMTLNFVKITSPIMELALLYHLKNCWIML